VKAVPNIISIFRICLIPVFIIAYFADERDTKYYAILIYAVASISDILDGYLARKLEAQSGLGKLLDPLGDKLMTFTVMIFITISRPVLLWAVVVFFIKEALMGIGGLILHKKAHIELPPARFVGKASAVVFFFICATLLLFRNLSDTIAFSLISVAIGLALIALAIYIKTFVKLIKSLSKSSSDVGEIKCNQHSVQDVEETPL